MAGGQNFGRIDGAALLIAHPAFYVPDLYDKKETQA